MLAVLSANAATIVVGAVVAGMCGFIAGKLYRDHRQGKHSCGGSCEGCPSCAACHRKDK